MQRAFRRCWFLIPLLTALGCAAAILFLWVRYTVVAQAEIVCAPGAEDAAKLITSAAVAQSAIDALDLEGASVETIRTRLAVTALPSDGSVQLYRVTYTARRGTADQAGRVLTAVLDAAFAAYDSAHTSTARLPAAPEAADTFSEPLDGALSLRTHADRAAAALRDLAAEAPGFFSTAAAASFADLADAYDAFASGPATALVVELADAGTARDPDTLLASQQAQALALAQSVSRLTAECTAAEQLLDTLPAGHSERAAILDDYAELVSARLDAAAALEDENALLASLAVTGPASDAALAEANARLITQTARAEALHAQALAAVQEYDAQQNAAAFALQSSVTAHSARPVLLYLGLAAAVSLICSVLCTLAAARLWELFAASQLRRTAGETI